MKTPADDEQAYGLRCAPLFQCGRSGSGRGAGRKGKVIVIFLKKEDKWTSLK
jgi:hypothetical protein